jgi:excisionase family DNA binding protein
VFSHPIKTRSPELLRNSDPNPTAGPEIPQKSSRIVSESTCPINGSGKGRAVVMAKEFLNVNELSEYLGIKKSTLYGVVANEGLPHYRIGRLIRFKRNDVDAWMEAHRVKETIVKEKNKRDLESVGKPKTDIDKIIKNAIDECTGVKYKKGGDHGLV